MATSMSNLSEEEMLSKLRRRSPVAADSLNESSKPTEQRQPHVGAKYFSKFADDCPFKDGKFHWEYAVLLLIGCGVAVYAERMRHMMDEARSRPEILERTPTPCTTYSEHQVQEWANIHVGRVAGGHANPWAVVLLGGTGAGKGTFLQAVADAGGFAAGDYVHHATEQYLQFIPEYRESKSNPRTVYVDAETVCNEAAAAVARAALLRNLAGRQHCVFEGSELKEPQFPHLLHLAQAHFRLLAVLIENTPGVVAESAWHRINITGRFPHLDVESFSNARRDYEKLVAEGLVDEAYRCTFGCSASGARASRCGLGCRRELGSTVNIVPRGLVRDESDAPSGET